MAAPTSAPAITPQRVRAIRRRLLDWYEAHQQPFPWRPGEGRARDPYAAMVAAVAAQQTQMPRVLEIYERWMAAYPTLEALARADRADVLRTWGRAGYPRRAVHLHEAARICIEQHRGEMPRDLDALLALPGVGPFTAAIVRCFGFGEDSVAIDTNVVRLVGRLVLGDLQPTRESSPAAVLEAATRLMPRGEASRWNPALMDFGARVCAARPRCAECPLATLCAARTRFASGEVAEPVRAQGAFGGSDREARGRILAALRASDVPLREAVLLRDLASDEAERERLARLVGALAADGLAWRARGRVGLGAPAPSPAPRGRAGGKGAPRRARPRMRVR